jgi:hypothetical protein
VLSQHIFSNVCLSFKGHTPLLDIAFNCHQLPNLRPFATATAGGLLDIHDKLNDKVVAATANPAAQVFLFKSLSALSAGAYTRPL